MLFCYFAFHHTELPIMCCCAVAMGRLVKITSKDSQQKVKRKGKNKANVKL